MIFQIGNQRRTISIVGFSKYNSTKFHHFYRSLVENGFPYEGLMNVVDNFEVRKKLMDVSPIKNIKNVQTPTLLLLGKKDLRIPPGPAIAYHNILKEMNVPTK